MTLRLAIGLAISGVALYVAFAGVDWPSVGEALSEADYGLLVAALPVLLAVLSMKAQRWRLLFQPETQVTFRSTFAALNVGYMTGNILPLQLGEVARVYVLGETEGLGKARVLSTVAVERVLDVFVLLLLLGVLIPFVELPRAAVASAAVVLAAFVVAAAVIATAVLDRRRVEGWAEKLSRALPARWRDTGRTLAGSLLDGLSALSHPRILVSVLFWTVASWLTSACVIFLVLRSFSLGVPFSAALFLLVATTFGFFVPSSPGAVGVYHAISIRTLTTVFGVAHEPATSFALVAHALYLIPPTILGAAFFWWQHLSLRRLQSWEVAPAPAEDAMELPATPDR